jgi:RNA polymerase sigma-70 factor (ECF subfamily)
MERNEWLAERFEAHRSHLHGVARRMLGSPGEAEDAVQEAWLRLSRADARDIDNLGGWLTTVVARVCLDQLRSRKTKREQAIEPHMPVAAGQPAPRDPETDALIADSVGIVMLVVLERLSPAERVAFVLHDMFDVRRVDIYSDISIFAPWLVRPRPPTRSTPSPKPGDVGSSMRSGTVNAPSTNSSTERA